MLLVFDKFETDALTLEEFRKIVGERIHKGMAGVFVVQLSTPDDSDLDSIDLE